ncbi:S-DNA-T family DNA segregation ATPase FtsK/SpoIIIE [Microbacterium resistens]|uniref:S-DNA-T family DNA segregation ATPase FtsK/SpoIIIE n=1 Tax=Microbacterium resistens TaxID=156977 RepID=A0ABU1SC40_9MICO|nr:FtsK/SpoIIIE domain-containing protein [Microbacterium resistens]MDR6866467.1 S-DNA-T family DNA segregation ATPase FtsK/SpoIIIE [Microbacterium resistens]
MDPADPLILPTGAGRPRRAPLPLLAAAVPVAAGLLMWGLTGSLLTLCFAALGPLMLAASFFDSARHRRAESRNAGEEERADWARVERGHAERVEAERRLRRRSWPDVAECLRRPPLRSVRIAAGDRLAIGVGSIPSPVRFSGGGGERAREFMERHRMLDGATMTVPLDGGVCVRGTGPVARAVLRALVLQACLRYSAEALRLTGEGVAALGLQDAPHGGSPARGLRTMQVETGERPVAEGAPNTIRMVLVAPGATPPAGIATVLDVEDPACAVVRSAGAEEARCAVEGLSAAQGALIAGGLAADRTTPAGPPAEVMLAELLQDGGAVGRSDGALSDDLGNTFGGVPGGVLRAAIGRDARTVVAVDLVEDGPHALVTGVTGSGKSELLVTWVTSLAMAHPPEEVVFVLADFKGGTAFDPLRELPHVAAVITDLDGPSAERGMLSLRAELRRREAFLAERGARSVEEAGGALPRLVLVVDEFAALLQEHPDLGAVFTDVAARGRALGMHLVLGTQRATGVIREALAANCPLRISLRVTDPQDSRLMLGSDAAAQLPGDGSGRGLALIRRPRDAEALSFRVARTRSADVRTAASAHHGSARALSPWLPSLPTSVTVEELRREHPGDIPPDGFVLGIADEPDRQRQPILVLAPGRDRGLAVFGGPASGKSVVLATLRQQSASCLVVPRDPESAWSMLTGLDDGSIAYPRLLLCDDLDAILARYPIDYSSAWAETMQRVVRRAPSHGTVVVVTAARCAGVVAAIADLLPRRALLRLPGRAEHLAAGGEGSSFDPMRPDGRARLDGREVQFALGAGLGGSPFRGDGLRRGDGARRLSQGPGDDDPVGTASPHWAPSARVTAVVAPMAARTAASIAAAHPEVVVRALGALPPGTALRDLTGLGELAGTGDLAGPKNLAGVGGETRRLVIVGDPDGWQRRLSLWQELRQEGEALVLAEAARELRTLAGVRDLPPYAETDAGRAWTLRDGAVRDRVVIAGLAPHREGPGR